MISAERLGGDQFAAELARHRDRDVDRFGLHPGLDAGKARCDALDRDADFLERQRGAAVAFGLGLALGGVVAVAIGRGLGVGDLLRDLGRRRRLLARLVGRGEVGVEQ